MEHKTMEVMPTFTSGEDEDKLEEAWQVSMDVFSEWWEHTQEVWKDYLQQSPPLPDLPPQVLDNYSSVSPAPLAELCPVDFEMRCWGTFKEEMEEWLGQQPRDEDRISPNVSPAAKFRIVLLGLLHMSGQVKGVCTTALCCIPDAMVLDKRHADPDKFKMCLVGNMAWELDEHTNLEVEVARLYSYMLLTDCYFGLVSCYTKTCACKRLPGLDRCVFVSPAVLHNSGDALKACAFVAWHGQTFDEAKAQASFTQYIAEKMVPEIGDLRQDFFSSTGPRVFDRAPILARLQKLGAEMNVANMKELVAKLAWWDNLNALENLSLRNLGMNHIQATANYDGGTYALVKFRDLSDSKVTDTDSMLRKFLREVDVYMRLRKLQGDVVPKLLEYGFVRGATVCFVVMTDHGRFLRALPMAKRLREARAPWSPEEISNFKSMLGEVHALGVHFGGFPTSGPGILLRMSHGFVDGDKAGMTKDIESVENLRNPW